MNLTVILLVAVLCLALGAVGGASAVAYYGGHRLNEARCDDRAGTAATEAEILGRIRLGEVDKAQQLLEYDMNQNVIWVLQRGPSAYSNVFPPTPRQTDSLQNVKIYRTAYPSTGPSDRRLDAYFATLTIPTISPDCNAAVCRMGRSIQSQAPNKPAH